MTDKFDILIFIYEGQREFLENKNRERGHVSWSDLLEYFVEAAPPFRYISKRTLYLWLLELIKEGLVEKIIDKETLKPCYRTTEKGYYVARRKKVEKEWIEEVLKATEKVFRDFLEREEATIDFISTQFTFLYEAWKEILKHEFHMSERELDAIYSLFLLTVKEPFPYLSFYFWLKNREFEKLKLEDIKDKVGKAVKLGKHPNEVVILAKYLDEKVFLEDWKIFESWKKKVSPKTLNR